MTNKSEFAVWLRGALAGRPNVYLVRMSGTKDNGRPVIDDSRVSKWLKGEQRPSPELASLAAEVLGRPQHEALEASGYGHLLETDHIVPGVPRSTPTPHVLNPRQLARLRAIHEELGHLIREIGGDGNADDTRGSAPTMDPGSGPDNLTLMSREEHEQFRPKAARAGTPQRAVTDRLQNEAGEERQDAEGDWEPK